MDEFPEGFTGWRGIAAEGARVQVTTCLRCGAAVVTDPADAASGTDALELHRRWHAADRGPRREEAPG